MNLCLYNSITKKKDEFIPLDVNKIRMYVCGPTVYDEPHIGNARPVIVFDLLYRILRNFYGNENVTYIRNITDVDDKINKIASEKYPDIETNLAIKKLTMDIEKKFKDYASKLECLSPSIEPRATEHISEMIEIIEGLIDKKSAYVVDGHVIFDINKYDKYGSLSNKSQKDLIAGARIEVATYKNNPLDFVLWKPSQPNEPYWDSPWGKGRPGWHIECSAMSSKYLGQEFDIHGGGIDLIFPHHENEVAQSCSYHSNEHMAKYFVHNGTLNIEGKKMSKSLGNVVSLNDLLDTYHGAILRFTMLRTHYRQPIDWTKNSLEESKNILKKWISVSNKDSLRAQEVPSEFYETLLDDINTPQAITKMHAYFSNKEYDKLFGALNFLGINIKDLSHSMASEQKSKKDAIDETEVNKLIEERNSARKAKDYKKSDEIRNKLELMGIKLQDDGDKSTWEYINE